MQNIHVILCRPQLWLNVGAVARVMSNLDYTSLRIVNPRDKDIIKKAYEAASHADFILDNAKTYETLEDAISDLSYVAMTSARPRDMEKTECSLGDLPETISSVTGDVGIVFGPERTGLTNEELALSDSVISLCTGNTNKSYNLSHATAIVLYQIFSNQNKYSPKVKENIATKGEITTFLKHLEKTLDSGGYFKEPAKKKGQILNLRSLFTRDYITNQDIKTLYGLINHLKIK